MGGFCTANTAGRSNERNEMNQQDAEEYTQALGQVVAGGWRQIALGQRLGVPKALKLSVDEWVKQRLGGYVKYSIGERTEAIRALANEDFTEREIATAVGTGRDQVRKALVGTGGTKHTRKLTAKKARLGTNTPTRTYRQALTLR